MAARHPQALGDVDRRGFTRSNGNMGRPSQVGKIHQGAVNIAEWLDRLAVRFIWAAKALIVVSLLIAAYYAADRKPPFSVLSVEPASAMPGELVTIRAAVRRDANRRCSAEMSRYIFDGQNIRFDIGQSWFTSDVILEMEQRSPGALSVTIQVPANAKPGQARLDSVLLYRCNRVHNLYPIEVTTSMPFTVLSPS